MTRPLDIHLIAIGGTGMAPLACLLRAAGHRVRGSDGPLYPPMSDLLASHGIQPLVGYDPGHLEPEPDLVVVGNAVPRSNPEAAEAERRGLERLSMPQALARFFLVDRQPLVVAGTHGKTTTSSMAAWVLAACGRDPGYLIGGVPRDLPASFRRGSGKRFVVEGDEYNAAYFDRGPKFLHYRPHTAILTSVEYDHADLYESPEALEEAYRSLVGLLPADGLLVACGDSPGVRAVAAGAPCEVLFYGLDPGNDVYPTERARGADGTRVVVRESFGEGAPLSLAVAGDHNLVNALAVWTVARADGLGAGEVAAALARFRGVARRMEEVGEAAGVTVIDDFAHHPTAVRATLGALRQRYPDARLTALFEPRSLSAARAFFHDEYLAAFSAADRVLLAPVFHADRLKPEECLDVAALARELAERGVAAAAPPDLDRLAAEAVAGARPGEVMVTMSSGAFGDLPRRLLAALEQHARAARP